MRGANADFAAAMLGDLRAGLAETQIEVCTASAAARRRPLARVSIDENAGDRLVFTIEVTDSVTLKRVARSVSLAELPADGRAFALAVATEELLRATWAELALRGVRKPNAAAPPEVRRVVEPKAPPQPSRAVGARLAFEHYRGGQTHYGGDAFWINPIGGWLGVELALGARSGLTVSAPHGSISGSSLVLALALKPLLLRATDVELDALLGAQAARVTFDAEGAGSAAGRQASGYTLYARGGFALALGGPSSLRSHTHLGAGIPLRAFSAADEGRIATGVSELEIFATTGISLGF